MTIKEVERLTKMSRANIRFYETEGLLTPQRNPNGHREYSEDDVEVLKKIKLLRMLHISLEEIKAVKNRDKNLTEVLNKQFVKLNEEKRTLSKAQEVCKSMHCDGAEFSTLKSDVYLKLLENEKVDCGGECEHNTSNFLIRRFLARGLDYGLYAALWHVFLIIGFKIKVADLNVIEQLLDGAVVLVLMLIVEPTLLSCFGTTVGKYIFGIQVTNLEGQRLSFREALKRTIYVIVYGRGVDIPGVNIWCEWKCYKQAKNNQLLPWEEDTDLLVDENVLCRLGLYAAILCLCLGSTFWAQGVAALPEHQGEISVAEFVENYNQLAKYYDLFNGAILTENGHWIFPDTSEKINDTDLYPTFEFVEENGKMKGMYFTGELISLHEAETVVSMRAFMYARRPESVYSNDFHGIWEMCVYSDFGESLESEIYDLRIEYKDLSNDEKNKFVFLMEIME